jgi:hypothetical protein
MVNKVLLFVGLPVLISAFAAYVYFQFSPGYSKRTLDYERSYEMRAGTRFTKTPPDEDVEARLKQLKLPIIEGANSIWGATGRDDRGHIWAGVSVQGDGSAHLIEYIPSSNRFVDHGDPVTALKAVGLHREGERQAKIHSKIIQADDGYLYFSSMDEGGEVNDGSRLPTWGSHLWRYAPEDKEWEHLFHAPEGLVAVSGFGRWIYALGYWDHVLYQYDTHSGEFASVRVGSVGGHVSRNFVVDKYGNAYVPRVESVDGTTQASLVQFDTRLLQVSSTPLIHYAGSGRPRANHGIVGLSYLADNSIIMVTGDGYVFRIIPSKNLPAQIEELGWFHPEGKSYTASVFPIDGKSKLIGISKRKGSGRELLEYDINAKHARVIDLSFPELEYLILYGSNTRDDAGKFYIAGRHGWKVPVLWQLVVEPAVSLPQNQQLTGAPLARSDPIPEQITPGGLSVELKDYIQIPITAEKPKTRINYLYHANDDSGRIFVNDMRGQIYIVKDGRLMPTPFLNMVDIAGDKFLSKEFELGLGSFAFHPDFARSEMPGFGKLYTVHTQAKSPAPEYTSARVLIGPGRDINHFDVITEWEVSEMDPDRVDPSTQREVLRIAQPWWDHNAGQLAFNPNSRPEDPDYGMLYIGVGDGGNTASRKLMIDHDQQGQDLTSPLGKILRINPLRHGVEPYGGVSLNPFVGRQGALQEIWAYGFRNPQRFSWDTGGDGKMLIGDIGQSRIEEINLGTAGGNYEWSIREGTLEVDGENQTQTRAQGLGDRASGPVLQYDHDEGDAVAGGFVYRGSDIPELNGKYIFGDIVNGRIFYANVDDLVSNQTTRIHELNLVHNDQPKSLLDIVGHQWRTDLRFGMDQNNELYILTKQDGWIRKLSRVPGGALVQEAKDAFPNVPVQGSLSSPEYSDDNARMSLPIVIMLIAGASILLICALWIWRNRQSSNVTRKSTSQERELNRYTSQLDNHAIEIDSRKHMVNLSSYELGGVRPIKYADIHGFGVTVNETKILEASRPLDNGLSLESLREFRNRLQEVEKDKLGPNGVRRIDLNLRYGPDPSLVHTLNFYFRQGNQRMTPLSYADTIGHVNYWCGRLATILTPRTAGIWRPEGREEKSPENVVELETTPPPEKPIVEQQEPASLTPATVSVADELERLVDFFNKGILTEEEFRKVKSKLLRD